MLFHSRFLIYVNVLDDESFSSLESPFRGGSLLPSPSLSLYSLFFGVGGCVVKRVTGGGSIPVLYTQVTTFCAGIWDGKHSESIYVGGDKRACHSLVTTNPHVCVCISSWWGAAPPAVLLFYYNITSHTDAVSIPPQHKPTRRSVTTSTAYSRSCRHSHADAIFPCHLRRYEGKQKKTWKIWYFFFLLTEDT